MIRHLMARRPPTWVDRHEYASPGAGRHYGRFYVGSPGGSRRATRLDTSVSIFACANCARRFYGTPLLQPPCPACGGRLQIVGSWDLTKVAWPWLTPGGVYDTHLG